MGESKVPEGRLELALLQSPLRGFCNTPIFPNTKVLGYYRMLLRSIFNLLSVQPVPLW